MAKGTFTVRSNDKSQSELTAGHREIKKLKVFGLASSVYDRDGKLVASNYLEGMAKITAR